MTRNTISIIFTLFTIFSASAKNIPQALTLDIPKTWESKYDGKNNFQIYTLTQKKDPFTSLILQVFPVPKNIKKAALSKYITKDVQLYVKEFTIELKDDLAKKHEIKKIKGEIFSGEYVEFTLKNNTLRTYFTMTSGKKTIRGGFTGTSKEWLAVQKTLKTIKSANKAQ